MDEVLLDTHALLWWLQGQGRLSEPARLAIDEAVTVRISAISFWEVATLVAKGRTGLDRPTRAWTSDVLGMARVASVDVSPEVAVAAAELEGFHGDPADRIMVATALCDSVPLVTKDRRIRSWAQSRLLTCIW